MLKISNVQTAYGESQVLFDVSLEIGEGEVVTLMGRNGMGKTTTVSTIMGLLPLLGGEAVFCGQNLGAIKTEKIARLGIGLVPEGRETFPTLTVYENLYATSGNRLNAENPWTLERIYDLFPRLGERQAQEAGTLSGGEQQMLVIGRALMTNPKLLILDEATEGLAPTIRAEIWKCIEVLKNQGQSILLIDKNIKVLKRLACRHYILEKGKTIWSGTSAELDQDYEKVEKYLSI